MRTLLVRIQPSVIDTVSSLLGQEQTRHTEKWVQGIKSTTGLDLRWSLSNDDLADEFDLMVRRNVSLIKSLSDDVYHRVERVVTQAVMDGTRPAELTKALTEQFGITQRRAKLIARDQLAKANAGLSQLRQEQCGIDTYMWSTALDERVRGNPRGKWPKAKPSHWAREGVKFRWDTPPSDGHPGHPVNCRCRARPVVNLD